MPQLSATQKTSVLLLLLLLLLLVSGCAKQAAIQVQFPPAADVEAATEAKPEPPLAIATSAEAEAHYNADVEAWGERVQRAGIRVCQWLNDRGAAFDCQ